MKNRGKKASIEMSFGMIFSIILIIAFVAVAFYAINIFLKTKKCADVGQFKQDLQDEINRAWGNDESSFIFSRNLDQTICFVNINGTFSGEFEQQYEEFKKYNTKGNFFFYPLKNCKLNTFTLQHINIEKTTQEQNPYCFTSGKIELKIVKKFNDPQVCLGDAC